MLPWKLHFLQAADCFPKYCTYCCMTDARRNEVAQYKTRRLSVLELHVLVIVVLVYSFFRFWRTTSPGSRRGSGISRYIFTMLVRGHTYSDVNTVPLKGTLFACYNLQQRIMAAK